MINVSPARSAVKGAALTSFLMDGHLEVLDGHLMPGSFSAPATSPVAVASLSVGSVLSAPARPSLAELAELSPVSLDALGCEWCGNPCAPSMFCSAECQADYDRGGELMADLDAIGEKEY